LPIPLVDGDMNVIRWIKTKEEFYSVLDEIEEFYGHPADLNGDQNLDGKDYGSDYFNRWMQDFTDWHIGHAENLYERTGCSSVLEVGCGLGNFVRAFLLIGVDAWGLDISRYAVENCHPEIRGRVLWGNLSDSETLPKSRFDLVMGYDVFEHAPNPDLVVRNVCNLSARWIHAKIPDIRGLDQEESRRFDPTHITGRSIKWWVEHFEENGFVLVLDENYTKLKWDPEYALGPTGAPDLHGLFKRKVKYV
jgi:SAM-dependent methyltransferase